MIQSISSVQIARATLSLSWIYHGLFPKLIHIAPLEEAMTASLGFNSHISYWITKTAGIGEIIFGCLLFVFYQYRPLIHFNILALLGLLASVALLQPALLIEAFNPVTTNLTLVALSFIILSNKERR